MNLMNRRASLATMLSGIASIGLGTRGARAQFTEQEVRNGLTVTATGDVTVDQAASGDQVAVLLDDGRSVTQDGVYRTATSQTVVNDGRITSTGDVTVSQAAAGNQEVAVLPSAAYYDGMPADRCDPGHVIADPDTGELYFQARDCCYYRACAAPCEKRGCKGDHCGS